VSSTADPIDRRLDALARQPFRRTFHLGGRERATVEQKGLRTTCCRTCLERWHEITRGRELDPGERDYVLDVIERWIERELGAAEGPPHAALNPFRAGS